MQSLLMQSLLMQSLLMQSLMKLCVYILHEHQAPENKDQDQNDELPPIIQQLIKGIFVDGFCGQHIVNGVGDKYAEGLLPFYQRLQQAGVENTNRWD